MICVCGENMCNDEHFSSEAPPITPGSGLFCYHEEYHHHGPHERWDGEVRECEKGEDFCITITRTDEEREGIAFRGCWSTEYEEGRYNFTGCEVRHVMRSLVMMKECL